MSHQESPTENKRNSENEMLAKGVVVWVPIIVTVVLYVMFKNDGFNGYAVVGFFLIWLNIGWIFLIRNSMREPKMKKYQIILDGFLSVSMLICFQIIYPDWYIYGWCAAVLGLIALLRFICSTPTNSQ